MVPGECNFTGTKADLRKVGRLCGQSFTDLLQAVGATPISTVAPVAQCLESESHRWLWLLDAAKLAATSAVDLSTLPKQQRPHFVALSFYKIFGYPTGLGALLVRRDTAHLLQKR
jgi:molybdenum cofactor sulfurtransferase